ncbi:DNA ligase D [Luteimonas sp. Y-2-2-4F]|nr:DNA ligase D [Luteimonas sp. Y-2-2-4F]MCD9033727.1 DNA ligase D [Luteimonas sp. Y-2-2-4F]
MSLREYARKRSFGQTPEPSGEGARRHGRRPIFVVQLHHARARHYDFRLEVDGSLKSWAVPKGPSLRPGEKRLAVQVEDHPLDYAGFEGDIPQGHYGAGHVDIFDHGVWSAQGDALEALAEGKLEFALEGERLQGAWKLIRTRMRGGKPQWLLLKRDDAWARDADADALLAERPIGAAPAQAKPATKKTATRKTAKPANAAKRAGTQAPKRAAARRRRVDWAQAAAALDGARPWRGGEPLAPQLATLREAPPSGDGWLHELKWDGYRLLADLRGGAVKLRSRNGLDWTADHPALAQALQALGVEDASFDGELVAITEAGRDDFSLLQRILDGSAVGVPRYMLFDLAMLAGVDLTRVPLLQRKALLERLLEGADPVLAPSRHIVGHGAEVFAASRRQGMEGLVSKAVDAAYVPGRSRTWVKSKHAQSDEFVVVGFTPPQRSRTDFGSLLVARRERGRWRYAGRVGTGFDQRRLRELGARLRALARQAPVLELPAHVPFNTRRVTWVEPRLVAELAYRGLGKEGLLRQASFLRLREDKPMADLGGDRESPRLTSPDKVVYAERGITKQQVADYYRAVADRLLPEVARRPLSLLRCPDGAAGTCFFQKHHADALGEGVHAVALREKDGGREDYLYIEDVEGLLALVQMNTLELHPWGATIDDLEHPDRLVFDLDPGPGVAWKQVIDGARDVRARLREIGLEGFARLSGGKGVHVVVPIRPGPGWDEAKGFCEAFAGAMAAQRPDRYVATASKAKRQGVIFIDWLRNGRGATSVASWSLRARAEAGVAMPVRWEELGKATSGDQYDLPKAQRRAASLRADPWRGWAQALKQRLPAFG